jgi:hypothetical protein
MVCTVQQLLVHGVLQMMVCTAQSIGANAPNVACHSAHGVSVHEAELCAQAVVLCKQTLKHCGIVCKGRHDAAVCHDGASYSQCFPAYVTASSMEVHDTKQKLLLQDHRFLSIAAVITEVH